jgi:hypothetical protein
VASLGVHFSTPAGHPTYRLLSAIRQGKTIDTLPPRLGVSPAHHLAGPDEVHQRFRDLPEAVTNTRLLGELCRAHHSPVPTIISKQEARQHHRVRRDSKSGSKGVRYNADGDTWTAVVYRHGRCYHVGIFYSKEAAEAAYERALRRENPDLHTAPTTVERPRNTAPTERGNPDRPYLSEGQ